MNPIVNPFKLIEITSNKNDTRNNDKNNPKSLNVLFIVRRVHVHEKANEEEKKIAKIKKKSDIKNQKKIERSHNNPTMLNSSRTAAKTKAR